MPNSGERTRNRTVKKYESRNPAVKAAREARLAAATAQVGLKQLISGKFKDAEELKKFEKLERAAQRDKIRRLILVLVQFLLIYNPTRQEFEHLLPYFGRPHRNWSAQSRKRLFEATGPQSNFYCSPDGVCTPVNPNVASTSFGDQMMFSRGLNIWRNPSMNVKPLANSNIAYTSRAVRNRTSKNRKGPQFNPPPPKQFKNTGRK